MELLATVTLLGIFAVVAVARLGPTVLGDVASRGDARRLAIDLAQLRRRAIATGDNHYLLFTGGKSAVSGYRLFRAAAGGDVEIDTPREFPGSLSVSPTARRWEFDFEGHALAAYRADFAGPQRTRRVDVVPLTGAVRVIDF